MRFALVFVLVFSLFSTGLWFLVRGSEPAADLPSRTAAERRPPVLVGGDLADEFGRTPFSGSVGRLEGMVVEVLDEDEPFVRYYVRVDRLARREGRPIVEGVTCAVFGPPHMGRPNLRATLESPVAEADLGALVHGHEGAPKVVRMREGVTVRDAQGRVLAEIPDADVDFEARTVTSDGEAVLRFPDHEAHVRGTGFCADLDLREASLLRDVFASCRLGGDLVSFSCAGPATVRAPADGDGVALSLAGGASMEHPFGEARCGEIEARFADDRRLLWAELRGDVDFAPAPGAGSGLERLLCPLVRIEGEDRVTLAGPVRAVWRGRLPSLALGERTVDLRAGRAALKLRRREGGLEPAEVLFDEGLEAEDRDGAGRLEAGALLAELPGSGPPTAVEPGAVGAWGGVRVRTPQEHLVADRIRARATGREELEAVLEGVERLEAQRERGAFALACEGPVLFRRSARGQVVRAAKAVRAALDGSTLACEDLRVELRGRELHSLRAEGDVDVADPERGTRLRGDSVGFAAGEWSVRGEPAIAEMRGERTLRAKSISRRESGEVEAEGDVRFDGAFDGRRWTLRCDRADGLAEKDGLRSLLAKGDAVVLEGPDGERFEGTSLSYDAAKRRAVLGGSPAVLAYGDGMRADSEGFDLRFDDKGSLAEASSRGAAGIDFLPAKGDRWRIDLGGPARLVGDVIEVPAGARIEAFEAGGARILTGSAARVRVTLERTEGEVRPKLVEGLDGVEVASDEHHVWARTLLWQPGSEEVQVRGGGRVVAEGWPPDVSFELLVFVLRPEGIDLRRASRVEVERR